MSDFIFKDIPALAYVVIISLKLGVYLLYTYFTNFSHFVVHIACIN